MAEKDRSIHRPVNRREFLRSSATLAGVLAGTSFSWSSEVPSVKRSATDWVTLGKSGIQVTRLACGSGTNGGHVQRTMGQTAFTQMIRHAYDQGVRFFESADNYDQMHEMYAEALKGIDRSTYKQMTKIRWNDTQDVLATLDRFRKELNSDYFDIVLLHCVSTANWPEELKRLRDGLAEATQKKIILAHGASCHGLNPLKAMPGVDWLDVALVRVNHDGTKMDGPKGEWEEKGNRDEAVSYIQKIHQSGTGVIGMKLIGNGEFTDPQRRDASIQFVMKLDCVDAVTIGFKNPAEVDEAIERMNKHLNA